MQPPPGSEAGLGGDPAAVGVGVPSWRGTLLWIAAGVMAVATLGMVGLAVLVLTALDDPGWLVLLVLLAVLWFLLLSALAVRTASIHRGPMLVVDAAGVRSRDLFGWLRVPWEEVTALDRDRRRGQLVVTTATGIWLNRRRLRRRALRVRDLALLTDPEQLLAYLQHRWSTAGGERAVDPPGSR